MNSKENFHMHRDTAQILSSMFNHKGAISIHAGSLKYTIKPGSMHYDQVKFLISVFGCDHVARKLQAGVNIYSTTDNGHAGQ